MKIIKKADGSNIVKISKSDWIAIGEKHGWLKKAQIDTQAIPEQDSLVDPMGQEISTIMSMITPEADLNTVSVALGQLAGSEIPAVANAAKNARAKLSASLNNPNVLQEVKADMGRLIQ